MRLEGLRVLVVGAGLAGLATARTLHRSGATVEVLERAAGPSTEGTGLYLPGNAVRALRDLGLEAEVTERAHRIERQRFADHRGRLLFEVGVDELWPGVGAVPRPARADLHAVLLAGAGEVPIRWGVRPVELTIDDHHVTVEVVHGSAGDYDLVVGADGLHSTVRRLAFDGREPRPVGQFAHRFVLAGAADSKGSTGPGRSGSAGAHRS